MENEICPDRLGRAPRGQFSCKGESIYVMG
jgi:hypothetical protein